MMFHYLLSIIPKENTLSIRLFTLPQGVIAVILYMESTIMQAYMSMDLHERCLKCMNVLQMYT